MCLDWRVLTGLGAVAVGIWLVAPQYVLGALPLLLVLACPLSMVAMALMMRGSMDGGTKVSAADRLAGLEEEQARIAADIAKLRPEVNARAAAGNGQPQRA